MYRWSVLNLQVLKRFSLLASEKRSAYPHFETQERPPYFRVPDIALLIEAKMQWL